MTSKIEWTDETWNPVTGCSRSSPACDHCYAARMARRLAGRFGYPADNPFRVTLHPERLAEPLRWRKPRRCFVVSMGDLFHEDVPDHFLDAVFGVMWACLYSRGGFPGSVFQLLTKRPARALEYLSGDGLPVRWAMEAGSRCEDGDAVFDQTRFTAEKGPHPRIWIGVTAEDQQRADERIPILEEIPAALRFVSCEPLLESIDFGRIPRSVFDRRKSILHMMFGGACLNRDQAESCIAHPFVDWVIAGGETGPCARPSHPYWFRSLRDQCAAAGVPFLFKGWGEWSPGYIKDGNDLLFKDRVRAEQMDDGGSLTVFRVGKRASGHLLDGHEHREFPETK